MVYGHIFLPYMDVVLRHTMLPWKINSSCLLKKNKWIANVVWFREKKKKNQFNHLMLIEGVILEGMI